MLDPFFFLRPTRCKAASVTDTHPVREYAKTACWILFACLLLFVCKLVIAARQTVDQLSAEASGVIRATTHQVNGLGQTESDLHHILVQANRTLAAAEETVDAARVPISAAGKTVQLVNQPCSGLYAEGREPFDLGRCGTLADVNRTLATARGTMGQAEVALHHEAANLDTLNRQEEQLVSDVHGTLTQVHETVADAHTLLSNPNVPVLLGNAASTSATLDHMLQTADQVETKATSSYLHPSKNPLVRTWHYVTPFLLPVAEIGTAIR